jgi:hypothetical protein
VGNNEPENNGQTYITCGPVHIILLDLSLKRVNKKPNNRSTTMSSLYNYSGNLMN